MLRAVLVVALALGAADAARPLGGAPTPAPTSPIVLGLCDCAFEAYGGCVLGDSTLVRAGREWFTTPRPPVHRCDAPRGSRLRAGTPGNARLPLFPFFERR